MATVGTFIEKDGRLSGKIQTLSISTALAFVPNENKSNPDAPTFRASRGDADRPRPSAVSLSGGIPGSAIHC